MHVSVVETWSLRDSSLHRLDPRAKLIILVFFLAGLSTLPAGRVLTPAIVAAIALALTPVASLAPGALATRALAVTALAVPFVLVLAWTGQPDKAAALLLRTYASAVCTLLFVATTTIGKCVDALRFFRVPALLVEVISLVYRYISLLLAQVALMRIAALSRGGASFAAGRGMVSVLFARSIDRAARAHQALLCRGYPGPQRSTPRPHFSAREIATVLLSCTLLLLIRLAESLLVSK